MKTATHPVAPVEVMAYLDGELSPTEAHAVSAHLEDCAECAKIAERFRATSQSLAQWTVPPAPPNLEETVKELASRIPANRKTAKLPPPPPAFFWSWKTWAIAGGGALAAALILIAIPASISYYSDHARVDVAQKAQVSAYLEAAPSQLKPEQRLAASAGVFGVTGKPPAAQAVALDRLESPATPAPMISRTVSLVIVVKDFAASRASLDSILARHHGYAAQLTVTTPENSPRSFQASLRIPAQELASALTDLKALGRVETESQSGEEVTQQHADLVARLQNFRETEERLRAILQQRTGKIEDVLQVEEEIARVRGEIETMEAEQHALEHRVDFATVDLQLTEEYKEQLTSPSASVSNRIHNAFVTGLRNAAAMLLGIFLFLVEFGPVLLIWLVILGVPAFLLWRRYRKMQAKL